jgi:hypothetical protein
MYLARLPASIDVLKITLAYLRTAVPRQTAAENSNGGIESFFTNAGKHPYPVSTYRHAWETDLLQVGKSPPLA